MANPWFRMYAEFATDPKVQMLPESHQRRLVMLFCIRCNGNETLHDEEVAFQLRISNEDWADTKAVFVSKGFIDSDNDILNWNRRQFLSDSSTERVARHREKKKRQCNVSVTPPDTDTDTDTEEGNSKGTKKKKLGQESTARSPKKGTRLPENWNLTKAQAQWSIEEQPTWTVDYVKKQVDQFKDYWIAQPSPRGIKVDWAATWRNWVRKAGPMVAVSGATGKKEIVKPWYITGPGMEAKGEELGLTRGRDEAWHQFYKRVRDKAGITDEQVRKAEIDFGGAK